jgi:rhomboid protease GluP
MIGAGRLDQRDGAGERAPVTVPPRAPARRATVTAATIVANLAVAAVCAFVLDGLGDFGTTIRAGANVRGAVDGGDWWRLPASVFVHVGNVHLIVNLLALWSIGRLVEGLFGSARTLAIYGVAGLTGALASHTLSAAAVSAGASGAIFGLLGAAVIELALHRKRYRREWRRSLLGALVVVTVAQLAVGFGWEMIDQWAHLGGLVGGIAMGALLSPGWRWAEKPASVWLGRALAAAMILIYAWGGVMAATHDYGDRLAQASRVTRVVDGIAVDAPIGWQQEGDDLYDPDLNVILAVGLDDEKDAKDRASKLEFSDVSPANDTLIAGAREWVLTETDALGSTQRYRMVLVPNGTLYAPEQLVRDAAAPLGQILASLRAAP